MREPAWQWRAFLVCAARKLASFCTGSTCLTRRGAMGAPRQSGAPEEHLPPRVNCCGPNRPQSRRDAACSAPMKPPPIASAIMRCSKKVVDGRRLPEVAAALVVDRRSLARQTVRASWWMEMLSSTPCGMMEGYLLTGPTGFFHTYEAFATGIASIGFNQHAKIWLGILHPTTPTGAHRSVPRNCTDLPIHGLGGRDHNGCHHQDPGFIDLGRPQTRAAEVGGCICRADCQQPASGGRKRRSLETERGATSLFSDKQKHSNYLTSSRAASMCAKGNRPLELGAATMTARRGRDDPMW